MLEDSFTRPDNRKKTWECVIKTHFFPLCVRRKAAFAAYSATQCPLVSQEQSERKKETKMVWRQSKRQRKRLTSNENEKSQHSCILKTILKRKVVYQ